MPTVAIVDGVRIIFFWNDHPPPHFHVEFAGHKGQISLQTLNLIEGYLPSAKLAAVVAWARKHHSELNECWVKARNNENPGKVG